MKAKAYSVLWFLRPMPDRMTPSGWKSDYYIENEVRFVILMTGIR
jgi:hypothetical protein